MKSAVLASKNLVSDRGNAKGNLSDCITFLVNLIFRISITVAILDLWSVAFFVTTQFLTLRRAKICPHPPAPSPALGEGEQRRFIKVFLFPSPLMGEGLGVRGEGFKIA
jgi:hypothetical protein